MAWVKIGLLLVAWLAIATVVGILLGRFIKFADRPEPTSAEPEPGESPDGPEGAPTPFMIRDKDPLDRLFPSGRRH